MTYRPARMKFGVFMAPLHHHVGDNPTLSFQQDLEFMEHLDRLDFDEAWIGEHHSGAVEIIADPFIFIAAAAERTRRIMLGSGVVDLPLHNPFMVADRAVMLDNLTRGRAMLGVGSGALRADFTMIGLDIAERRRMSEEAMDAIMALLRAEAPVTMKTDWFDLKDARIQLASYTKPHLPVGVAGSSSESGEPAAAKHGVWQLSFGGGNGERLRQEWERLEAVAAKFGRTMDRADWRVTKFFHLAETRQQALDDCRELFPNFTGAGLLGAIPDGTNNDRLPEIAVERGGAIIGTPQDAIEDIERLQEASGGFGGLLGAMFGVVHRDQMMKSYDLFARYVAPHFQGQYRTMKDNREWVVATGGGPGGPGRGPGGGGAYAGGPGVVRPTSAGNGTA
ncbi:MAG TPA: LLM class flavin-dependent oxidoreductase [Dehalococcoidia bacterium]|nr:LLM class flavin-dependent oxidoreductase [Dehalococcoidia bacterium]